MTTADGSRTEENRRETGRSGLLLAASIEAGTLSAPVRIRNLSETGAEIEGAVLPPPGAVIILRRLDLAIRGVIVWASGMRCGVHFERSTAIGLWMGGRRLPEANDIGRAGVPPATLRSVVAEPAPRPAPPPAAPAAAARVAPAELNARLAGELDLVRTLLDRLGDALTEEPEMLARHSVALQSFDLVDQILGHVAQILVAEDPPMAIGAIGMEELRARLLGKPRERA